MTLQEKQVAVADARRRLKEIADESLEICKGQSGYVGRLFAHYDRTNEEKARLTKIIDTYQPEIDKAIDDDMAGGSEWIRKRRGLLNIAKK